MSTVHITKLAVLFNKLDLLLQLSSTSLVSVEVKVREAVGPSSGGGTSVLAETHGVASPAASDT